MIFGSPRQALGYLYAAQRGPQLARPRYHDAPPSTDRTCWDHVEIGALLYGPRREGYCGVTQGSALDLELRAWATHEAGAERTNQVRAIERRLRGLLRRLGLQHSPPAAAPRTRQWIDPDGQSWTRLARST